MVTSNIYLGYIPIWKYTLAFRIHRKGCAFYSQSFAHIGGISCSGTKSNKSWHANTRRIIVLYSENHHYTRAACRTVMRPPRSNAPSKHGPDIWISRCQSRSSDISRTRGAKPSPLAQCCTAPMIVSDDRYRGVQPILLVFISGGWLCASLGTRHNRDAVNIPSFSASTTSSAIIAGLRKCFRNASPP